MMTKQIIAIISLLTSFAFAHEGYNTVFQKLELSPYQISLFEDTHEQNGVELNLLLEISQDNGPLGQDMHIQLELKEGSKTILATPLQQLGTATSNNGKSFYTAYALTTELEEAGPYEASLSFADDNLVHTFQLTAMPTATLRAVELIPSIILLVPSLGLAWLILSTYATHKTSRKDAPYAQQASAFNT